MIPSHNAWPWIVIIVIAIGATLPAPGFTLTYVRGGVLLDLGEDTRFKDKDCAPRSRFALYGCDTGIDGEVLSSVGDFGTIPGLEIGLGYILHPSSPARDRHSIPPGFLLRWQLELQGPGVNRPARRLSGIVRAVRHAGSVRGYFRASFASVFNAHQPVHWRRWRAVPYSDRGNPHGLSGNLYHRAGRRPRKLFMDANGGIRDFAAGTDDGRRCLAIHGSRCHRDAKR